MTRHYLVEGAGWWLAFALASGVAAWAALTTKQPAAAILSFGTVLPAGILLVEEVLGALGPAGAVDAEDEADDDERRRWSALGFAGAMAGTAAVGALILLVVV